MFLKIKINLLENVLGLKGDHTDLMFEFLESVIELESFAKPNISQFEAMLEFSG